MNETTTSRELFNADLRRDFEHYGMGMAVRWQQVYGAPRRADNTSAPG